MGLVKRIVFSAGVTLASILVMFALWGGPLHPRAELGLAGYLWLYSSAAALFGTPVWALAYPYFARSASGKQRIVRAAAVLAGAVVLSYAAVLATFIALF